jgi:hypothetical protein
MDFKGPQVYAELGHALYVKAKTHEDCRARRLGVSRPAARLTMKPPSMRPDSRRWWLPVALALAACRGQPVKDHGPAPAADHQATVRAVMDRVLDGKYRLDGAPAYRFAAPAPERVASWLFEPEIEGRSLAIGFAYGWGVGFWVTPRYVGYPEQPEGHRMAFFSNGRLRGIFVDGPGNGPLELDRWCAVWVDPDWRSVDEARR